MEDRDLKKLKRSDLLEILLQQNHEIERLEQELKRVQQQLSSRKIAIDESGSMAEAALKVNDVFTAAQAACDQYIENIKQRYEEQELMCAAMKRETKAKCDQMLSEAEHEANIYWEEAYKKIEQFVDKSEDLKKFLSLHSQKRGEV